MKLESCLAPAAWLARERTLTVEEARAFYDQFGARQDWQWWYADSVLKVLLARADFQNAQSIIEFGCGTGRFASRVLSDFAPCDCRYLGIDVSSTMIALARERLQQFYGRAQVRLSDGATAIPERDTSVGRFVSTYVFDLLSREQIASLLAEARRVLTPDGRLCLVSLTHGRSGLPGLISWAWQKVHAVEPRLVGGCRPIELLEFIDQADWRVEHLEVVTVLGLSSEALVASPR